MKEGIFIMEDLPQVLKATDIANYLNVSKGKAYQIMRLKDFPKLQFGRTIRVKRDDFLEWVEKQKAL